ncbi:MAG TPA: hypothetical protein VFQ91_11525 [Bryobacteraceae bacterium]|nr:hypothetical protein [Bryobacteraceae bacterium]
MTAAAGGHRKVGHLCRIVTPRRFPEPHRPLPDESLQKKRGAPPSG